MASAATVWNHRASVPANGPSPTPVSYTHLDVYKRQGRTMKIEQLDQAMDRQDLVDKAGWDSFPASDPPTNY